MLWVDQPVSTGFAQGVSHAKNEVDVAKEFVKFYKNWQKIFDTQKSKIYITGESYAGRYVPYIGAQMLDEQKTSSLDLAGALVYDPCIGDCGFVQMEIPTYRFARENNGILNLNQSFLAQLEQTSTECGYEDYIDTYLQFPPPKHQPPSKNSIKNKCDISYEFEVAWNDINPCFNVYYIADFCPILSNQGQEDLAKYLNRKDVKEAIHAPKDVKWTECGGDVFHHGDHSPDSVLGALPQVIEATNRVLVGNADWDALIPTNGTLLSSKCLHGDSR
jgi:carboxypeptidase D